MKQHRQSTAAMALMTVAAFIVIGWASSVVAEEPAGTTWALSQQGVKYEVFRRRDDRPGHHGAFIYIVQTRMPPEEIAHGVVFLQTRGSVHGEGFVRGTCTPMKDDKSLTCEQKIGKATETLIVGAINSQACIELRKKNEEMVGAAKPQDKKKLRSPDGKNPVATPEECSDTHPRGCICYDISNGTMDIPPNSGSGTGGHN